MIMIHIILKAGKIGELDYLANHFDLIAPYTNSRTSKIKNLAHNIYKECYLWIGEGIKIHIDKLKKPSQDLLNKWIKNCPPEKMKKLVTKKGGNVVKYDAYESAPEQSIDKKFQED